MDPLKIFLAVFYEKFEIQTFVIEIMHILLIFLISQWLPVVLRCFVIIVFGTTAVFLIILKNVQRRKVTYSAICLYKKLMVERNMLKNFEKLLTSGGFTGVFFILVGSTCGAIISVSQKSLPLFAAALLTFFVTFSLTSVAFYFCCSTYEISSAILQTWESQRATKTEGRIFIRQLIASCRPLNVPVGDIGIMDRKIKMNYFEAAADYTVNLLMAVNELLN